MEGDIILIFYVFFCVLVQAVLHKKLAFLEIILCNFEGDRKCHKNGVGCGFGQNAENCLTNKNDPSKKTVRTYLLTPIGAPRLAMN